MWNVIWMTKNLDNLTKFLSTKKHYYISTVMYCTIITVKTKKLDSVSVDTSLHSLVALTQLIDNSDNCNMNNQHSTVFDLWLILQHCWCLRPYTFELSDDW